MQPDIEAAARMAYNIHFIKYRAGHHEEGEQLLKELSERLLDFRVSRAM
jgi:hypothetical protein